MPPPRSRGWWTRCWLIFPAESVLYIWTISWYTENTLSLPSGLSRHRSSPRLTSPSPSFLTRMPATSAQVLCWPRWHLGEKEWWRTTAGHSTRLNVTTVSQGGNCSLWGPPLHCPDWSFRFTVVNVLLGAGRPAGTLDRGTTGILLHSGTQTRCAAWWQVAVSGALKETVLRAVHGAPGSGHVGISKTLRRLRQGFYWGQHRRDVEDYCRCCDSCTVQRPHRQIPCPTPTVSNRGSHGGPRGIQPAWPGSGDHCRCFGGRNVQPVRGTQDHPHRPVQELLSPVCLQPCAKSWAPIRHAPHLSIRRVTAWSSGSTAHWRNNLPQWRLNTKETGTPMFPSCWWLHILLPHPTHARQGNLDSGWNDDGQTSGHPVDPGWNYRIAWSQLTSLPGASWRVQGQGRRGTTTYIPEDSILRSWSGCTTRRGKKGRCPKLDSKWMEPCRVLERLSEVVYRVQLSLRGRKGTATPLQLETGAQGARDTVRSSPQFPSDVPCSFPTVRIFSPFPGPCPGFHVGWTPLCCKAAVATEELQASWPPGSPLLCPWGRGTLRGGGSVTNW